MRTEDDQVYTLDDHLYVPFIPAPLAGGPFLPFSEGLIEEHAMLPLESKSILGTRDRYVADLRTHQRGLAAARICGDSMKDFGICNGKIVVFQRWDFPYLTTGDLVLIERMAHEGAGAWALKRLIIRAPSTFGRSETGGEIRSNDPVWILRSHNRKFRPWKLDPDGAHRVHGIFKRSYWREEIDLVNSDEIRRKVTGQDDTEERS